MGKSRGIKRDGNPLTSEPASKKEALSPEAVKQADASADVHPIETESPIPATEQKEDAMVKSETRACCGGNDAAQKASVPEASQQALYSKEAPVASSAIPEDGQHNTSEASEPAAHMANGNLSPQEGNVVPSSSSSEAEAGPIEVGGSRIADVLQVPSLDGAGQQPPSQPKAGLQGVHLDLSKRSTEDQPAWYCLIPMAKAEGNISKARPFSQISLA